jgi:hypothetical protein
LIFEYGKKPVMIPPAVFVVALLATGYAMLIFLVKRAQFRRWNRVPGKIIGLVPRKKKSFRPLRRG